MLPEIIEEGIDPAVHFLSVGRTDLLLRDRRSLRSQMRDLFVDLLEECPSVLWVFGSAVIACRKAAGLEGVRPIALLYSFRFRA